MGTNSSRDGDPRLSTGATSSRARCLQGQPEHAEPTPLPAQAQRLTPTPLGCAQKHPEGTAPRGDSTLRGLIQGATGTNSAFPNPAKLAAPSLTPRAGVRNAILSVPHGGPWSPPRANTESRAGTGPTATRTHGCWGSRRSQHAAPGEPAGVGLHGEGAERKQRAPRGVLSRAKPTPRGLKAIRGPAGLSTGVSITQHRSR